MRWLTVAGIALYCITLPFVILLRWLLYLLYLLAVPFIYTAYVTKEACLIPWRFLAQFEALWYFFGSAVVLGALSGLILHLIMRLCVVIFDLDRKSTPRSIPAKGHDAISYRRARQTKKRKELERQERLALQARLLASQSLVQDVVREARQKPVIGENTSLLSPGLGSAGSRSGLLKETILEHTDEEDDESVF